MNVLQRGVRSVLRKPIKSIILLFIVIVMSGLFLGAMASRSATGNRGYLSHRRK